MSIQIIPALMPHMFADIARLETPLLTHVPLFHIDIMDGEFVPSRSWPYGDGQWGELESYASSAEKLPHHGTVPYEAHLMVADPARVGELLARIGVSRIVVHAEALTGSDIEAIAVQWRAAGASDVSIALNLGTPLSALASYTAIATGIQLMSIPQTGYQGEVFTMDVLARVAELQRLYPELPITLDGGVNVHTIPNIVHASVARCVVGSAIFDNADPLAAYTTLQSAVDNPVVEV